MKNVHVQAIVTLIVIIAFFAGCRNTTYHFDASSDVELSSSIEKYHVAMSSVPGLPLRLTLSTKAITEGYQVSLDVAEGELSYWLASGKIERLDLPFEWPSTDTPIYWTPFHGDGPISTKTSIVLVIKVFNHKGNLQETIKDYAIEVDEEGYFSLISTK